MKYIDRKLSEHFYLSEFIISQTASREGIDNSPSHEIVQNLKVVANQLELVRSLLGNTPIYISSGYRCPELNTAVGGADHSAHMSGFAADFTSPPPTAYEICLIIAESTIKFDQLIYEYDWVHFGLSSDPDTWRHQCLTAQGSDYI